MKIKLLFVFVLTFFGILTAIAQPYGNEWINYDRPYYKFKVVQEGIYKITYQTLQASGVSMSELTPQNIQIFGRDKEQPIVVFDGGDNSFDSNDYFVFYAERNNGWLDSTLFEDPNTIGNPGYSIFSDTIYYFFSWNDAATTKRFTIETAQASEYSAHTELTYMWGLAETYGTNSYNIAYLENGVQLSQFSPGEGYYSGMFGGEMNGSQYNYDTYFNLPSLYSSNQAPNALFHGKSNSNSNAAVDDTSNLTNDNHHLIWMLGNSAFDTDNLQLVDTTFRSHKQIITNKNIPNYFLANSLRTRLKIIDDLGALTDYQSFSYMSLYYPRTGSFNGLNKDAFYIKNSSTSKSHVRVTNSSINANPLMLVFGGSSPKYIVPENLGGGNWRALISNSGNNKDQKVIFQDVSNLINVNSLSPVNSYTNSLYFTNLGSEIYDSANLMIYHPSLDSVSRLYRDYRSLNYNVVYANIEELYLQFGGGIPKHNAAIRRFALYAYNQSTVKPVALTLLGKGYNTAPLTSYGRDYNMSNYGVSSLIPAFGNPGSDICYTANLLGSGYAPLIPIGRVSVNSNEELSAYLDKLQEYEIQQNQSDVYTSENKDWQKQIIHFVGGNPGYQNENFFGKMEYWRSIIEDYYYAGHVTSYRRISTDPLDPSLLNQLADQLENGVSLVTFLGHSSADGFDISVDEPNNWNNAHKYPVVYGNGCHSGDIYSRDNSFGEKMIRIPDEGAIAYVGSADQEYDVNVDVYSIELYSQFSNKDYGKPLSHQIQNAIVAMQANPANEYNLALLGTYGAVNLDGDPLLKLNWHTKPEIEITEQSFYFEPSTINLSVDSIELNLVIKNLGISVTDTFTVNIKRDFPGSSIDSLYSFTYNNLNYVDTLKFKIPVQGEIAVGVNNFEVKIDESNFIPEQYEEITNNQLTKSLFLQFDAIVPVYPYEFAVIPRDTVTVKASTVNPIGGIRKYLFELDTIHSYNSPEKRVFSLERLGGVQEVGYNQWLDVNGNSFPLICQDSMVYFWRTAVDSTVLVWNESSFQYIKGKEGWGQNHFYQFKKNNFENVTYDSLNRKRTFLPVQKDLKIVNFDNASSTGSVYFIDGQWQEYGICSYIPAIHLAVIDPISLNPWHTLGDDGHDLGNSNCRSREEKYFIYYQDSLGLNTLNNVLRDSIPDGFYIVLYTTVEANYSAWSQYCPGLFVTMANLGATLIHSGQAENSFIFFTQIGAPSNTEELLSTGNNEEFIMNTVLNSGQYKGYETSTIIGPSTEWKTIYWKQDALESSIGDTTRLTIELLDFNQIKIGEIDTVFTHVDSILEVQNLINAATYPYIRFKATYNDKVNFTPAQVDRWHVLYTPVPEAAIDGLTGYSFFPQMDTIYEGQDFNFAVDIKNISDYPMDSLLVYYYIENENHVKVPITYPRQDSLRVLQVLRDTIKVSTTGFPGLNSLWVEVNPYINGSLVQTDQLEQYHFNNLLQIPFYVKGDDVNPILDVTFNGRHILNGDIIDPNSEILISLKDDNVFQIMNDISDTTLFGIFLTSPDGVQKRIPFIDGNGNQVMQWYPAESMYKKFKIIYPAFFEQDGIYHLQVQGTDRSGNISGDIEYKINFEVIHESTITYLMNYPNPFSTSTRFVFTLTGSEIPEEFLIQIMTVSGKVVRQITEDELGPIHIGRNITDYAWDGTDDFGDPLANGVYIYRVLSRLNGEEIKHRETDGDKYFTKEYGKMYIIR
ncbi:MAG: C25 family cysteine peptidase [Flavobacteriia bacterium]|jgi:hypothetical protein